MMNIYHEPFLMPSSLTFTCYYDFPHAPCMSLATKLIFFESLEFAMQVTRLKMLVLEALIFKSDCTSPSLLFHGAHHHVGRSINSPSPSSSSSSVSTSSTAPGRSATCPINVGSLSATCTTGLPGTSVTLLRQSSQSLRSRIKNPSSMLGSISWTGMRRNLRVWHESMSSLLYSLTSLYRGNAGRG